MRETGMAGTPGQDPSPATLSRRRVLQLGAAALPALCGARLLAGALSGSGVETARAADETAPADGYDPSAHSWAFAVDTTTCIGCGRCVEACKHENHVPEEPEMNRTWVELHVLNQDGSVRIAAPDGGIDGFPTEETMPEADAADVRDSYFVPRLCMQCENPPCTWVCPVSATFKNADGVVLVDEIAASAAATAWSPARTAPGTSSPPATRCRRASPASPTSARSATTGSPAGQLPGVRRGLSRSTRGSSATSTILRARSSVALRDRRVRVMKPAARHQATGLLRRAWKARSTDVTVEVAGPHGAA